MGMETANRLYHYRMLNNVSIDDIANKLGVSNDTIVSWEHGESTPEPEQLVAIAEIYNITVDELLKGTKSNDSNKSDDECNNKKDFISFKDGIHIHSKDGDKVDIGTSGVHVHDKNGEKVDVGWNGIYVNSKDGKKVYTDNDGVVHINEEDQARKSSHKIYNKMPFAPLIVLIYFLFGMLNICGGWSAGWIIFLAIPLYYTLGDAIYKKNPNHFAFPVLVTAIYLYLGMFLGLWHPMWILFLTVPLYYCICDVIKNINKQK